MTGFRADETNQYPCFRIFVGKTYDSLNQIQQQTWELVMIQNLGERGRMNSPMVSQSTAGRISESTTINENDVRLVYLLWESSTQSLDQHLAIFSIYKREVASSSTMSLTDVAAKKTISTRIFVHDVESICHVREAQRVVSRQTRQRTKDVASRSTRQVGGGIVAARAYVGLDARNS